MKRSPTIVQVLTARCTASNSVLPDNYSLYSLEDKLIGVAAIPTLALSMLLREKCYNAVNNGINCTSLPVEVQWNERFSKYQVIRILPADTPITTSSFFCNK